MKKKRPIRIEGDIAHVPLTQGYTAVIDAADVPLVDGWNWSALVALRSDGSVRAVYAMRREWLGSGIGRTLYLHRVVAKTPDGMNTDHRDGNGLNNRQKNLRTATTAQNAHNARTPVTNKSGLKGVSWYEPTGKWVVKIVANGKQYHRGYFETQEAAAIAYAAASAELHGTYGRVA